MKDWWIEVLVSWWGVLREYIDTIALKINLKSS